MLLPDERLRAVLAPADRAWEESDLARAAVLAPIFRRGGEDWLVLTKRRDDLRSHAGQVSFPGGAREGNESPSACALRECHEEIGLHPDRVALLGALPAQISSSRYLVHTLVGRFTEGAALHPDPGEVDVLLEIRAAELFDPGRWELCPHEGGGRTYRPTPHFAHGPFVIWGLTGILIHRLMAALGAAHD